MLSAKAQLALLLLLGAIIVSPVVGFGTIEHRAIGDAGTLRYIVHGVQKNRPAKTAKLDLPNGNKLSFGEIIGLAGDFYGVVGEPISEGATQQDRERRFNAAFGTLAVAPDTPVVIDEEYAPSRNMQYMSQIIMGGPMKDLESALAQMQAEGKPPSEAWAVVNGEDERLEIRFNKLTGGTARIKYQLAIPHYQGKYMKLAIENFDHFNAGMHAAYRSYAAGHAEAMRAAQKAKQSGSQETLMLAYAKEAFAQHFLTDMFSAGHMRTPRNELQDFCARRERGEQGGHLSKAMHDEDNLLGLRVTNKDGLAWRAYGDRHYFSPAHRKGREAAEACSQRSIDEVFNAFKTGHVITNPTEFGVKNCLPNVARTGKGGNHFPMFSVQSNGMVEQIEAKGDCEKKSLAWYRTSCNVNHECKSMASDPCTGYCVCKGWVQCTCVKDQKVPTVFVRKDLQNVWDNQLVTVKTCAYLNYRLFDQDEDDAEEEKMERSGRLPGPSYDEEEEETDDAASDVMTQMERSGLYFADTVPVVHRRLRHAVRWLRDRRLGSVKRLRHRRLGGW